MLDREAIAERIIVKFAERSKLQLHPGRNAYMWVDPVRKKGGKLLVSLTACVGPALVLHVAYYCFMCVVIGSYVYSLPANTAKIPDLAILCGLVVGFVLYRLDIRRFEL